METLNELWKWAQVHRKASITIAVVVLLLIFAAF